MTKDSRQKADASLRVDEQGGILVGLRLDPAVSARRAELTDPVRISETEERLHDFAARLDEIEALGDLFNDDIDTVLRKPAPDLARTRPERDMGAAVASVAAGSAIASAAETAASGAEEDLASLSGEDDAGESQGFEMVAVPTESDDVEEGTATEIGAPSSDIPGLRPPGASDFEDFYGSDTASEIAADEDIPARVEETDTVPATETSFSSEDPFNVDSFTRIDETAAEINARISEEVIEIGEIDHLPEDAVEDFAWSGAATAEREGWEAFEDDDDRDFDGFDPDFPDDAEGENYGALDAFLSRSDVVPAEAQFEDSEGPRDLLMADEFSASDMEDDGVEEALRRPEDRLEEVLRDDLWLDEIMPDETVPEAKDRNDEADVWENPMTRPETELPRENARASLAAPTRDEDPLAFLDHEEPALPPRDIRASSEEVTPKDDVEADPAPAASAHHDQGHAVKSGGILGFLRKDAKQVPGSLPEETDADMSAAVASDIETDAEKEPKGVGKGSRLPLVAASAVLAVALGFGLVNMGVIPMGSSGPDVSAQKPEPGAAPALPEPPADVASQAEVDPLSQELADLRDAAPPVEAPVPAPEGMEQDRLDRVARGLESAAEGDIEDLFLPESAAPAGLTDLKAPALTQELIDGFATDADIAETRAAIDRMFSDMQEMQAKAQEREAVIATLQARIAEIETLARRAETLALAQNEVIVDVVRLQEQMLTAEELVVDLSRRVAAIEAADPADRVSVERSLEDLDRRISGLSRDVGLVARMSLNGTAAPLSLPVTGGQRTSEPKAPGAGAVYQDSEAKISPTGSTAAPVPAEVKVGDFVDRYGYVLDIVPTSDGSRLVVMENGSVIVP